MHLVQKNIFIPILCISLCTVPSHAQHDSGLVSDTIWKGWQPVAPAYNGFITDMIADSHGHFYCIQDAGGHEARVYQLQNKQWVDIQPEEYDYAGKIWLNSREDLVMEADGLYFVFRKNKWNITTANGDIQSLEAERNNVYSKWMNAPALPAHYAVLQKLVYTGNAMMLAGIHTDSPDKINLLAWTGNEWKTKAQYPVSVFEKGDEKFGFPGYRTDLFYVADSFYSYDKRHCMVFDDRFQISQRQKFSIQPVPAADGVNARKANFMFGDAGIFWSGNKIGIRNSSGDTLVQPVFDSITLEESPSAEPLEENSDFALHLQGGPMNFFIVLQPVLFRDSLEGFINFYNPCPKCEGRGKLYEQVLVKSDEDWVPEKLETETYNQYTSIWDAQCKCYQSIMTPIITTKTVPGYFKKRQKTELQKGGRCDLCNGGERAFTITRDEFLFDRETGWYYLKEHTYYKSASR